MVCGFYCGVGLFNEDQVPWLLDMLKSDVFGGAERISRDHFMTIRGESPDKNAFWRGVSQIAVEKFNMQEVFNMRSTVRLTAIEKLCECCSRQADILSPSLSLFHSHTHSPSSHTHSLPLLPTIPPSPPLSFSPPHSSVPEPSCGGCSDSTVE